MRSLRAGGLSAGRVLVCGHHYHSAHASVVGTALCKEVYHGQHVCGGLAGAGLGAGNEVVAVEDDVDSLFLNRVHSSKCMASRASSMSSLRFSSSNLM